MKLLIDLVGLVFASLRVETIAQSGKGTSVTRSFLKIGPENSLRFRKVFVFEQDAPQS